jgi:hypothetical protein
LTTTPPSADSARPDLSFPAKHSSISTHIHHLMTSGAD